MRGYAAGWAISLRLRNGAPRAVRPRGAAPQGNGKSPDFLHRKRDPQQHWAAPGNFVWSYLNEFDGENRAAAFTSL